MEKKYFGLVCKFCYFDELEEMNSIARLAAIISNTAIR